MIQDISALLKIGFEYFVQIISGLFFGSAIFLGYAKWKTGGSFQEVFSLYVNVLVKSLLFSTILLATVFGLIHYVPILYIVAGLLVISSLSICFKYVYVLQSRATILTDGCIVLVNIYCSYLLIMDDHLHIDHYIVLGIASFCFFLYQQIKKI